MVLLVVEPCVGARDGEGLGVARKRWQRLDRPGLAVEDEQPAVAEEHQTPIVGQPRRVASGIGERRIALRGRIVECDARVHAIGAQPPAGKAAAVARPRPRREGHASVR